ncbi:MAG: hypothetical protein AAGE92_05020 [Cyanobacteria bacterium P01_G01_bin.4]
MTVSTALQLRRRSQLLGTPVFMTGDVERLGFVSQIWVDVHALRVVGWSIRRDRSPVSSAPQSSIAVTLSASQLLGTGALLLESGALSTPLNTDAYARLIPQVLKTQTGVSLGRLKDFTFDLASGAIASVRTSGTGIPLLPAALDSTFEIPRTDLISNESLTAADGAEERLTLLKRGLLEQAGIGKFNWALPLSASEAPAPDKGTLEAIAEATAAPLSVETTSAESETAVNSEDPNSGASNPEDAGTDLPETSIASDRKTDEKPLDRAIEVLTSSIQPLLQKLPTPLRQRLGISDLEPEEEASQPSSPIASEESVGLEEGVDVEDSVETSAPIAAEDSEESVGEEEGVDVEESADVEEGVETSEEPEITPDTADSSEQDTVENTADSTAEISADRTEEIEEEPEASVPPKSSSDEDVVATAPDTHSPEPLEEKEDSDEEPEEQSEVVDRVTHESEEEAQQEVESESGDEATAEDEQPPISTETNIPTSDSGRGSEPAEIVDEDVESPPEAESINSEIEVVEAGTSNVSENAPTAPVGSTIAAASVAVTTGIVSSGTTAIGTSPETQTEVESVAPSSPPAAPPPVAPSTAAPQPSDDTVPPALQPSLPRVPRSAPQTTSEPSQAKPGAPLQSFVSLPQSKGRVPKSGGVFEPQVKGS